ncbi:MAG: twin-arginine translocase TatA/TatE family subunit [Clostridiales bacterium]|nr:twin-arginine translocase TatA/TatE family subunit [Clostridiales bacterium]
MFNLGMMEIVVVLAVAFLIVGPKDLPKVARWIARQLKSIKKLIRQIKQETGWDEFAKEFQDTAEDIKSSVKDADIRQEIQMSADELRAEMDGVREDVDRVSKQLEKEIEA